MARLPSGKAGNHGRYGTPNIDIEEGYITIEHNGRYDVLPYPKQPGSFYHLSKVHDSHNMMFACKIWGIRATDLNQGVVYGTVTDQPVAMKPLSIVSIMTKSSVPLSIGFAFRRPSTIPSPYTGPAVKPGVTSTSVTIPGALALASQNPAKPGECRVINQFTEQFSVLQLAHMVQSAAKKFGLNVQIEHLPDPRVEAEEHYYNAKHTKLVDLKSGSGKCSICTFDPNFFAALCTICASCKIENCSVNWLMTRNSPRGRRVLTGQLGYSARHVRIREVPGFYPPFRKW